MMCGRTYARPHIIFRTPFEYLGKERNRFEFPNDLIIG